jgi:large subunit ribosomal protein L17
MFRNLATSLIEHERFETTVQKAKDLRRVVEKLVTLAATDNLHNRRLAHSYLTNKNSVHKLFAEVGPRFKGRAGGFTRVIRTRVRVGDAAEMAMIEFVDRGEGGFSKGKKNSTEKAAKGSKEVASSDVETKTSKKAETTSASSKKAAGVKKSGAAAAAKKAPAKKSKAVDAK